MAVEVPAARRRFTRKEYYRMVEVGILGERDRVELIRGEIVEMSGEGAVSPAAFPDVRLPLAKIFG